jgi:hypothetical protein
MMNRREFVRFSALAASFVGAASPLFAAETSTDLLGSPDNLVGQQFALDDGTTLTLQGVESLTRDARLNQWLLRFSADKALTEGTHVLRSRTAGTVSLFLQCNADGDRARAHVSRLA